MIKDVIDKLRIYLFPPVTRRDALAIAAKKMAQTDVALISHEKTESVSLVFYCRQWYHPRAFFGQFARGNQQRAIPAARRAGNGASITHIRRVKGAGASSSGVGGRMVVQP